MKKWTIQDRYGNTIYITQERWYHILESRPELEPLFDNFLETIRTGRRKQDALIPNEYRYFKGKRKYEPFKSVSNGTDR